MQKGIMDTISTISSSLPANHDGSIGSESESSNQTAQNFPESEKAEDSPPSESKKSAVDIHSNVVCVKSKKLVGDEDEETVATKSKGTVEGAESGRERLKRHRVEMAGRVWIPDMWGHEHFLNDWVDCTAQFDASLVNKTIMSARDSLVQEARRANSTRYSGYKMVAN